MIEPRWLIKASFGPLRAFLSRNTAISLHIIPVTRLHHLQTQESWLDISSLHAQVREDRICGIRLKFL